MHYTLYKSNIAKQSSIRITGSKSESNRLLLLQALYPEIELDNVSNSDDSNLMTNALNSTSKIVDIHQHLDGAYASSGCPYVLFSKAQFPKSHSHIQDKHRLCGCFHHWHASFDASDVLLASLSIQHA